MLSFNEAVVKWLNFYGKTYNEAVTGFTNAAIDEGIDPTEMVELMGDVMLLKRDSGYTISEISANLSGGSSITDILLEEDSEFSLAIDLIFSDEGGYIMSDSGESFRIAYNESGDLLLSITEALDLVDYTSADIFSPYMDGEVHTLTFKRENGFLVVDVDGISLYSLFKSVEIRINSLFTPWPLRRFFTRLDTNSKGFSLPSPINLDAGPVAVRVRMAFFGAVVGRIRPAYSNSAAIELDSYDDSIDFRYNYSGPSSPLPAHEAAFGDGSIVEYLLKYDGSNVEGFINGASTGVLSRTPAAQTLTSIFATGSSGGSVIYPLSVEVWGNSNDTDSTPSFEVNFDSDGTSANEIDVRGGNNLTRVGLSSADTELFTFDDASNSWKNSDSSVILPVTYS